MNQILVTQKLYVTPELKRKKRSYKIKFLLSIIAICLLLSYYAFMEYKKDKSEEVSQQILTHLSSKEAQDNTVRNVINDVLIVSLDIENSTNQLENVEIINEDNATYLYSNGESYTTDAILNIPSLGINYPVLSETSDELLKISLNKYWGPNPNSIGNYCIVGHNYTGKFFGNLHKMTIGDTAILTDMNNKSVTYEVYDKYVVDPTDVSCTSQLTGGRREITLITCKNYGTQRLVLKCREI